MLGSPCSSVIVDGRDCIKGLPEDCFDLGCVLSGPLDAEEAKPAELVLDSAPQAIVRPERSKCVVWSVDKVERDAALLEQRSIVRAEMPLEVWEPSVTLGEDHEHRHTMRVEVLERPHELLAKGTSGEPRDLEGVGPQKLPHETSLLSLQGGGPKSRIERDALHVADRLARSERTLVAEQPRGVDHCDRPYPCVGERGVECPVSARAQTDQCEPTSPAILGKPRQRSGDVVSYAGGVELLADPQWQLVEQSAAVAVPAAPAIEAERGTS